jgi:hypothetical protein
VSNRPYKLLYLKVQSPLHQNRPEPWMTIPREKSSGKVWARVLAKGSGALEEACFWEHSLEWKRSNMRISKIEVELSSRAVRSENKLQIPF